MNRLYTFEFIKSTIKLQGSIRNRLHGCLHLLYDRLKVDPSCLPLLKLTLGVRLLILESSYCCSQTRILQQCSLQSHVHNIQ